MSFFVQATPAKKPRTKNIQAVSLLAAGVIAFMVVSQLFTFEDFPGILAALHFPLDPKITAATLVSIEVFSLPFLLSLRLSPLFRTVSMVLGWVVGVKWLFITIYENTTGLTAHSSLFGATFPLPVGWWSVLFALALGVLIAWVSWGMWPLRSNKR